MASFRIVFTPGGPGEQVIEADDYVQDGSFLSFREKLLDGSFERVMGIGADVVERIEAVDQTGDTSRRPRFLPCSQASR
jgi:hypothetical protein